MTDTPLARLCDSVPSGGLRAADRLFLDRISRLRVLLWTLRGLAALRVVKVTRPGRRWRRPALFVAPTARARARLRREAAR